MIWNYTSKLQSFCLLIQVLLFFNYYLHQCFSCKSCFPIHDSFALSCLLTRIISLKSSFFMRTMNGTSYVHVANIDIISNLTNSSTQLMNGSLPWEVGERKTFCLCNFLSRHYPPPQSPEPWCLIHTHSQVILVFLRFFVTIQKLQSQTKRPFAHKTLHA